MKERKENREVKKNENIAPQISYKSCLVFGMQTSLRNAAL